jgi:gliding motility-associated-like protein
MHLYQVLIRISLAVIFLLNHAEIIAQVVAYYPMNGNVNDLSGNGHNAMMYGGPLPTTDRFGTPSGALYFDGVDDYIRISDNGAFSTPAFSLSFWFLTESSKIQVIGGKRDFPTSNRSEFSVNIMGSTGTDLLSFVVGSNKPCSAAGTDNFNSSHISTTQVVCTNRWYHVAITYGNGIHKLYVDGNLKSSANTPFTTRSSCLTDLRFGVWWQGDPAWFKGKLDDVRWYSSVLSPQDVVSQFDNFTGSSSAGLDFTFNQSVCNPKQVDFYANSGTLAGTAWDFGDGKSSTGANSSNTYANFGTFNVKFTAQKSGGCTETISKTISINSIKDNSLIATNDTTICLGKSINLKVADSGLTYCWNPVSSQGVANAVVTPLTNTTYVYTAQIQGPNLVSNGDFTLGAVGFTSDYSLTSPNTSEGQFWVASNANAWNPGMSACKDHTTATGNMMMVNGSPIPSSKVWTRTIPVSPNTNYEFSVWITSLHASNPARLKFSINNLALANEIIATTTTCKWDRFYSVWNSGSSTSAEITILNNNTILSGNDFALDDISFSKTEIRFDSVTINVIPAPLVRTIADTAICTGSSIHLPVGGAANYVWTPASSLSDSVSNSPIATPVTSTLYMVTGWNIPGCTKTDSVTVSVKPSPQFSLSQNNINGCKDDIVQLTASGADHYTWYTDTKPNLGNSPVFSTKLDQSGNLYVALHSTECNIRDTLISVLRVDNPPLVTITKSNDIDCFNTETRLTASGGQNFSWSPAQYINNTGIHNPVVTPQTDTWYKVTVSNGVCVAVDSVLVKSGFRPGGGGIYIPTAFTPDGNGRNDIFKPAVSGIISKYELTVYNRWGQLLFKTNNPQIGWNGTFNAIQQPGDTYVYLLKAEGICSGTVFKKGTFTLIR